jgi:hypothetical protein
MPSLPTRFACIIACCFVATTGCTDGPFFQMKKLNPYIQSQWRKDREKAVVYSQRVDEMRLLRSQFKSMKPDEQTHWVEQLNGILANEPSPELRREAVLALQQVIERPDAVAAVAPLIRDNNEKVRLTVAQTLSLKPSPESTAALLSMATSDPSNNVRLAATKSLGKHSSDEVRQFLAQRLDDRSPAMQYQASLALKEQTGKDFGGDIELWKRFLQGEDVSEPKASIADSLKSIVPTWR